MLASPIRNSVYAPFAAAASLVLVAAACDKSKTETSSAESVQSELGPDNSWVRIDGTIVTASDDSFELDYGEGLVTVEMDDWDWYDEGKALLPDDRVIVRGRMDKDLYESRKIEAASVYVENLGTTFYASAADEEDLSVGVAPIIQLGAVSLSGTVESVTADQRKFVLDTGSGSVTVDVSKLDYNPLDDEGYQQIDAGQRVHVMGRLNNALFDQRKLIADHVTTLSAEGGSS